MTVTTCRPPLPPDLADDPGALAVLGPIVLARSEVSSALARLTSASGADWVSVAAEQFRTQLDDAAADLRALLREIDALESSGASLRRASRRALDLVRAEVAAQVAAGGGAPGDGGGAGAGGSR